MGPRCFQMAQPGGADTGRKEGGNSRDTGGHDPWPGFLPLSAVAQGQRTTSRRLARGPKKNYVHGVENQKKWLGGQKAGPRRVWV